jgi:hypothetical protein
MISLQTTKPQVSTPIECSKTMIGILLETPLSDIQRRYIVNLLQNILEIEASTLPPINTLNIKKQRLKFSI